MTNIYAYNFMYGPIHLPCRNINLGAHLGLCKLHGNMVLNFKKLVNMSELLNSGWCSLIQTRNTLLTWNSLFQRWPWMEDSLPFLDHNTHCWHSNLLLRTRGTCMNLSITQQWHQPHHLTGFLLCPGHLLGTQTDVYQLELVPLARTPTLGHDPHWMQNPHIWSSTPGLGRNIKTRLLNLATKVKTSTGFVGVRPMVNLTVL